MYNNSSESVRANAQAFKRHFVILKDILRKIMSNAPAFKRAFSRCDVLPSSRQPFARIEKWATRYPLILRAFVSTGSPRDVSPISIFTKKAPRSASGAFATNWTKLQRKTRRRLIFDVQRYASARTETSRRRPPLLNTTREATAKSYRQPWIIITELKCK